MRVLGRGGAAGEDIAHMNAEEVEGWVGELDQRSDIGASAEFMPDCVRNTRNKLPPPLSLRNTFKSTAGHTSPLPSQSKNFWGLPKALSRKRR